MGKKKIKIIIADDHAFLRKGLAQIISETPDLCVVAESTNGEELLEMIRKLDLDVVVMDVEMPKKSGWDVMLQMKSEKSKLPVIILSVFSEEDYAVKFFKAGASGYLTKTSAPELLVEAIRKVARGGRFISPELAELLAFELGKENEKKPHENLSPREFQIFTMIASGKTVTEIARELSLSVPTVSTHRAHILEKMNIKSNARLTHYAFRNNLLE
ncbi:MAG: DNA-binding response regulator [Nitrospinaceae bacterium]|nr:MAG: DNA-binding response regulator [Nitrospinaceae bacterium]